MSTVPDNHRVMVVEDEALIAHDIVMRLSAAGFEVPAVVDTGERAVTMAGELTPDLILMDIRLKGTMDGIEAASQIRRLYDIPVIYLTAHADRDTINRAKAVEPHGYLTKPLGRAILPSTVEIAIHKH
jgi:CheY-like chemotaxis protein